MSKRSSSPGKKDGKKKKKISKKRAAELAELERRRQEDARAAEIAEHERLEKEARDAKQRAEDERNHQLELARLATEKVEIDSMERERDAMVAAKTKKWQEDLEWEQYIALKPAYHPAAVFDFNTFIGMWEEKPITTLEEMLAECQKSFDIMSDLVYLMSSYEQLGRMDRVAMYRDYRERLWTLMLLKLDKITAHILVHAEDYVPVVSKDDKDPKPQVVFGHTKDIHFGLWVNLAKNPRTKVLEFGDPGFSVTLPKALALAFVALRFIHFSSSHKLVYEQSPSAVHLNAGLISLELLQMPPAPKRVANWTIRPVTQLSHALNRLTYPISQAGVEREPPPIGFSTHLPPHSVIQVPPTLGVWDTETGNWVPVNQGLTTQHDIRIDPLTRVVTAKIIKVGFMSLIQPASVNLPFTSWQIDPAGENKALLTLGTQSGELEFEIHDGSCCLMTAISELKHLHRVQMPPGWLVQQLALAGFAVLPQDSDAVHLPSVTPKDRETEARMYHDLCMLVAAYKIGHNKWNQQAGPDACVFRFADATTRETSKWTTGMLTKTNCAILIGNSNDSAAFTPVPDGERHYNLRNCLKVRPDLCSPGASRQIDGSSVGFQETVKRVMTLFRLFSFG